MINDILSKTIPDPPNPAENIMVVPSIREIKADILILKGSAGTGKTTLVAKWVTELKKAKIPFALLASTGRAAKILREKANHEAGTIHSAIYTFDNLKGQPDDPELEIRVDQAGQLYFHYTLRTNNESSEKPEIIIIDESSMITHERAISAVSTAQFGSGSLLDDLISYATNSFIVFVGDHCQLPPVSHSSFSSALSAAFLRERYNKSVIEIEINQIWRHKEDSEILKLAHYYRQHILSGKALNRSFRILRPMGRNVFLVSAIEELTKLYLTKLGSKRKYEEATCIAATNRLVDILNKSCRANLGFSTLPQPGELLSVVQNNPIVSLVNGDLVVLRAIAPDATIANISFSKVIVQPVHSDDKFECLMINNLLFNNEPSLNVHDAGKLIIDYDKRARSRGVHRNTEAYKRGFAKDPYLNALRVKFGYCLTCHKAQGGEWDTVFLALNGAQYYMPPENAARWYYTAITRAKNQLYLNDGKWVDSNHL